MTKPKLGLPNSTCHRVFAYLIAVAIITQALILLVDNYSQSIWAWDSVKFWVHRSAAWHGTDSMGFWSWTGNEYVLKHYSDQYIDREPPMVSLTYFWAISLAGAHSSNLISLPAVAALYATGGLVYSQTYQVTSSIPAALAACLVSFTIPLLTTHGVSAGYADIWLTLFITAFISIAFSPGGRGRSTKMPILVVLAASLAFTKEKGIWFATYCAVLASTVRSCEKSRPNRVWATVPSLVKAGYCCLLTIAILGRLVDLGLPLPVSVKLYWPQFGTGVDYILTILVSDSWGFLFTTLVLLITLFSINDTPGLVRFSELFVLVAILGFAALATTPSFRPLFSDGTTFDRASLILAPQATVIIAHYFHQIFSKPHDPTPVQHVD